MKHRQRTKGLLVRLVLACIVALASMAAAQQYPVRPVRILVPFPPGGAADTVARTIGDQLSQTLNQPIVVDNRSGAGGRLATELLAKAEPDGYTLLVGTGRHSGEARALLESRLQSSARYRADNARRGDP